MSSLTIFLSFSYLHYTMIHSLTTFLPCYSLPSASSPSPSPSSLSSSSLPSSAAFSFPFHMGPPPPALPCVKPPTRPECPKALVNASTMSASCSCPASCFSVILSRHSCSQGLPTTTHSTCKQPQGSCASCLP